MDLPRYDCYRDFDTMAVEKCAEGEWVRYEDVAESTILTPEQRDALREIVGDWIAEGFTTPPYTDAQYDLFEALRLDPAGFSYDIRRPALTRSR